MAILNIPDQNKTITDFSEIKTLLNTHGIFLTKWEANKPLSDNDSQETILEAYSHELKPFMDKNGFKTADVINVHKDTPNVEALRGKFLKEHTHSEDEVRFFVDGEGLFWFHLKDEADKDLILNVLCQKGDFMSVPKGYKHWFDLAPKYHVKAIRIFTNVEGWVANYTESKIDERYNP